VSPVLTTFTADPGKIMVLINLFSVAISRVRFLN
jgi:hypothetical protein